jgi:hypothetical protein
MSSGDDGKTETTYSRKQIIGIVLVALAVLVVGEVGMKLHDGWERRHHPALVAPPDIANENSIPPQGDLPAAAPTAPPEQK